MCNTVFVHRFNGGFSDIVKQRRIFYGCTAFGIVRSL